MSGSTLDDLHGQWLERPGYKAAYDALAEEFAVASALIEARGFRSHPGSGRGPHAHDTNRDLTA
jgi:hypothetical protein